MVLLEIRVELPDHIVKKIDNLVRKGLFKSRQDFIKQSCNLMLLLTSDSDDEEIDEYNDDKYTVF